MLTPLDIQKKEFRSGFRGYHKDEVDSFLDLIIQDYEGLFRENLELKEKLSLVEQQMSRYREIEEILKDTMIIAQKNSEELRQNTEKEIRVLMDQARIEAECLAREAEQEAGSVLQEAERRAREIITRAEDKVKEIMEEYHKLQRESQIFRMRFRAFLEAQIKILDAEEEDMPVMKGIEEESPVMELK